MYDYEQKKTDVLNILSVNLTTAGFMKNLRRFYILLSLNENSIADTIIIFLTMPVQI